MKFLRKEKTRVYSFIVLLLGLTLFSGAVYSKNPKYITRVYSYKGEFDVRAKGEKVTLTEGYSTQVEDESAPEAPSLFVGNGPKATAPKASTADKPVPKPKLSKTPVESRAFTHITRIYCYEGSPLYIQGKQKTLILRPGEYTQVVEGKPPENPDKIKVAKSSAKKSQLLAKSKAYKKEAEAARAKPIRYTTRIYCFEGEPLSVQAGQKTLYLRAGQLTEVEEGKPPQRPYQFREVAERLKPDPQEVAKLLRQVEFKSRYLDELAQKDPQIKEAKEFAELPKAVRSKAYEVDRLFKEVELRYRQLEKATDAAGPQEGAQPDQAAAKVLSRDEEVTQLLSQIESRMEPYKVEEEVKELQVKKKKVRYVTKTTCYEGVVEVWGKRRRVFLFPGEFTTVLEGEDPTDPSGGDGGDGGDDPGDSEEDAVDIASLSPSTVGPGFSGNITLSGTGFKSGAQVTISGADITINTTSVISSNSIIINVSVSGTAASGLRDVSVTNIGGSSDTFASGLTISNQPTITGLVPNTLHQGRENEDIVIAGTNFQAGISTSISGTGVTVNSTTYNNPLQITVNVTVGYGGSVGARNVIVTNTDGGTYTEIGGFTVTKGNYIYVANLFDDNATIIDVTDNTTVDTISLGNSPAHGEVNPAGTFAYIPNMNDHTVSVIDMTDNSITDTISLGPANATPEFLCINPNGNYVYVSDREEDTISIISTATDTEVGTTATGDAPVGIDVSPDGSTLYVALAGDNRVREFTLSNGGLTLTSGNLIVVGNSPYGLRVDPDDDYVYTANRGDNNLTVIRVSDLATKTVAVGNTPQIPVVTGDGSTLYVTNQLGNSVTKVDVTQDWAVNWAVTNVTIVVGNDPVGLGLDPDGEDYLYVANQLDDEVDVIDTNTDGVVATLTAGDGSWAISVKDPGNSVSLKQANKRDVTAGDIVTYTIRLRNNQSGTIFNTSLVDNVPAGLEYIRGSSYLDGLRTTPTIAGRRFTYNVGDIAPGSTSILLYQVRVSAGAIFGKYVNTASASGVLNGNPYVFPRMIASVRVVPDPIFDLGTVIGKVFYDANNNGMQDKGEGGVDGVSLVTEEGIIVTTDENGKYHIPGLWPHDHVIKVDTRTVPWDKKLNSQNPVVVQITEGLLSKVNFPLVEAETLSDKPANKVELPFFKDDYFLVLLGALDIHKFSTDGNADIVSQDDRYENRWHFSNRLSYYFKGTMKGEYIITSSLNTERENQEFMRYIDPDKYYPIYGDDSTVDFSATNTQGKFFLKIEKGSSYAMWGNFRTDFAESQLVTSRRALYGGRLYYEGKAKTSAGQPKSKADLFVSTVKQEASHDRFRATGGSLYYLKHDNVVAGSERVYIEVQDRISRLGLAQVEVPPMDYEIDYDSGRIILLKPLSSIAFSSHIISEHGLLNGEPNFLIVDYEYEVLDKMHADAYGARLSHWITNNINVGTTYTRTLQDGEEYELYGVDTQVVLNKDNWASFEYARSFSSNIDYNSSFDGGLTFSTASMSDDHTNAKAFSFRASSRFFEGKLLLQPYFKKLYPGFSNAALLHLSGTEIMGIRAEWMFDPWSKVRVVHNVNVTLDGSTITPSSANTSKRTQTSEITYTFTPTKRTAIEAAYRMVKKRNPLNRQTDDERAQIIAGKVSRRFTKDLSGYVRGQRTVEGKHNNQVAVGVNWTPTKATDLSLEQSYGTKGDATLLGITHKISDKASVTSTFGYAQGGFVSSLGSTVDLDNKTRLNYSKNFSQNLNADIVSLSKEFNPNLDVDFSFERSQWDNNDETTYRNVFSGGLHYSKEGFIDYLLRLELRQDRSPGQGLNQALIRNYLKYILNQSFYVYLKANLSADSDRQDPLRKENYREFSLGFAYRPVDFDKFNCLFKLTHLHNRPPESQESFEDVSHRTSNVASFEYAYDFTDWCQLVQKAALKLSDERVDALPHQSSKTYLSLNRLNIKPFDTWQLGLEYRVLSQDETESLKKGFLFEIDKYLTENLFVGVGYNFTDFSDELTNDDSYESKGVFFKVRGIY